MIYAEFTAIVADIPLEFAHLGKASMGPGVPANEDYRTIEIVGGVYRVLLTKENHNATRAIWTGKDGVAERWGIEKSKLIERSGGVNL